MSEGLLIAMAPVVAYALTLSFMVGFAEFFHVPASFLSLNIGTMFSTAGDLLIPAALVLQVFFAAYYFMPRREHPVAERFAIALPIVALLVFKLAIFGTRWQEWLPTLLVLIVMAPLLFSFRPSAGAFLIDRRVSRYLETITFRRIALLYIVAWMALTISHDVGRASAMFQQEYLVPASSPETVVLTSFGDNLIIAAFDRKTKEVDRSFSILKKGEDPKLVLRWERIGPLHLKSASQSLSPQPTAKPAAEAPVAPKS